MAKTERPMVRIHDLSTNEIVDREMNDEEFAQWTKEQEANAEKIAEAKAKESVKKVVLNKLGLSEEEVAALLS